MRTGLRSLDSRFLDFQQVRENNSMSEWSEESGCQRNRFY
ncbi:hypothetical protein EVA_11662 [gut metagenome]|uniref:Uncharacterized protein n=1 Tax=gut metagenome TaxID=749906 RepID=J9GEM3_9ZZZZ